MVEIVQNKSWPNFHQLNKFYGTYVDLGVRESCGKTNTYVFFWWYIYHLLRCYDMLCT